jgi:hypothetical protein
LLFLFRRDELGEVESLALATSLGLATVSALTLAVSAAGFSFASLALWICLILPLALGVAFAGFLFRRHRESSPRSRRLPEFPVSLWLIVGVPATVMALLYGLMPPYDFDVLEYHFEIPKEWNLTGVGRTDGNVYGAMPQGAEMFVLWGMDFESNVWMWRQGTHVGKAILAGFIPLTSLLAASIAGRIAGRRAGLFAGWTALTLPWLWSVGVSGLVDHVWGLYFLAASWTAFRTWFCDAADPEALASESAADAPAGATNRATDRWRLSVGGWRLRTKPSLRWAALAGAFFGAACACKYPAVPLIGGPLVLLHVACCVAASRRSGFPGRSFWLATLVAAFTAVLLGGGWYVKNVVLYGNPVFPLATNVFGDAGWPEELQANWNRVHRVPGETFWQRWSPIGLVQSAWLGLFATAGASPLVPLGLVAFTLAKRPARSMWIILAIASGFFLTFWLTTHRIDRFLVPTYPLLAVVAGAGFAAGTSSFDRLMRQVAFWLGLAWCLVAIPYLRIETHIDARLLQSFERLKNGDGFGDLPPRIAEPVQWLNENVKLGTVLSIGDAAVFDFEAPVVYHTCFDECPLQVWNDEANGDAATLRAKLVENEIAFVYVHWGEIARYRSPGNYGFPFPIVTREGFATLVEQGVLSPPRTVGPPMGEKGSPAWEIYPVAPEAATASPPSTEAQP